MRPDSAKGKQWKSKVQWDLCDQFDTRGVALKGTRVQIADQEARENMERETAFNKYYSKLADSRAAKES